MWIFGYGSLIWKVDFPIESRHIGYVVGFRRKFYQFSTDHRGTPEKPGRVVTLIPCTDQSKVWGVAYKIRKEDVDGVLSHLDYREKGGYKRMEVLFYPSNDDGQPFEITIYVGTKENANYAGEADEDAIAEQICRSVGPSGRNVDYLLNLAAAMREIAPHVSDDHLYNLERKVLNLMHGDCVPI